MRKRRSLLAIALALLGGAAAAHAAGEPELKAGVFSPPRKAPAFSLVGSNGGELSLEPYRGKVVILEFGFTSCPDVCPTTLAALAQARKQLGPRANDLQVVYITVDPERDDAERLRRYLAAFDPSFIGGTGTPEQLASVRDAYGIAAQRTQVGASPSFSHSSFTYLIDREGMLRALMPYGHAPADYAHDVEILLGK
jgi:protein SCO1/2